MYYGDSDGYDYYDDYSSNKKRSKILTKEEEIVLNINNSINRRMKSFFNAFEKHKDPISYILSNKIIWLYNSLDDIGKTSLHNYILYSMNSKLEADEIKVTLTIDRIKEIYKIHFRKGDKHILDWIPIQDKIIIPNYDKVVNLNELLQKKEKELVDLEEEMFMTNVLINKPISLVDNGMRRLYILSVFRPKKFKLSMSQLIDELNNDKLKLELEINSIKERIDVLSGDKDLLLTLRKAGVYFIYFPKINNLTDYVSVGGM